VFFHRLNSILLSVFRNMSNWVSWHQIIYMYKTIAMGQIAINTSVTGSLPVSCWFVRIYFFKYVQQTYFTLLMWLSWNLLICGTVSSLWCIVTSLRKNYLGSSISGSTDLQAGILVSITAMVKWLLVCLQMAISTGPTQVCHGVALVDVAILVRNSRTNFNRVCVPRWVHCGVKKQT